MRMTELSVGTMIVTFTGPLRVRMWIAMRLIRLAAWILGYGYEEREAA